MTQTIQCEQCGRDTEVHRANAKYCRLCRLMKNLQFLGTRKYACLLCDAKFAPLSREDCFCAVHDAPKRWTSATGTCRLCEQDGRRLLHEDVRVCLFCAKDPSRRKTLIRAVAKKLDGLAVSV